MLRFSGVGFPLVAVGTGVSPGPPHRSERAELLHPALILSSSVETRRRPRMTDLDSRQPSQHMEVHPSPGQSPFLAASPKRSIPGTGQFLILSYCPAISACSAIHFTVTPPGAFAQAAGVTSGTCRLVMS